MEIERRCSECRHVFDGHPLSHKVFPCPKCGSPHTTIVWTDESLDGQDFEEVYEDDYPEEENND